MNKVQLGSGSNYREGWVNIDIEHPADIIHDLTNGIPLPYCSVDFIQHEHMLEHLTHEQGRKLLIESRRVLKDGGVLRIAMPDLDYIVEMYNSANWNKQEWLTKYGYEWIKTPCEMINVSMRDWGHKFLYDEDQIVNDLINAGFKFVERKKFGKSKHKELQNLETRGDSKLIVEAW